MKSEKRTKESPQESPSGDLTQRLRGQTRGIVRLQITNGAGGFMPDLTAIDHKMGYCIRQSFKDFLSRSLLPLINTIFTHLFAFSSEFMCDLVGLSMPLLKRGLALCNLFVLSQRRLLSHTYWVAYCNITILHR